MAGSRPGLDALLEGIFDYAGMFPPASLSFDQALAMAAGHPRDLKHRQIIAADLVVSVDHLPRLTPSVIAAAGFDQPRPFRVCVLGSSLTEPLAGIRTLRQEIELLAQHSPPDRHSHPQPISYEFKIAPPMLRNMHEVEELGLFMQSALTGRTLCIFLEPDLSTADWVDSLERVAGTVAMLDDSDSALQFGLKVRCSGPQAVTAQKLCSILKTVAAGRLHFKATAGLHHPIIEKGRYGNDLGFLNLAIALYLKRQLGGDLPAHELLEILLCSDIRRFDFDTAVSYGPHRVDSKDICNLKKAFHFSIGSCSLLEPDQDLLRLLGA